MHGLEEDRVEVIEGLVGRRLGTRIGAQGNDPTEDVLCPEEDRVERTEILGESVLLVDGEGRLGKSCSETGDVVEILVRQGETGVWLGISGLEVDREVGVEGVCVVESGLKRFDVRI